MATELTETDIARFTALADEGFGVSFIAREFGYSTSWARRTAHRLGVEIQSRRNAYPNLRARVEDMQKLDAIDYLLTVVEKCFTPPQELEIRAIMAYGFLRKEAAIVVAFMHSPTGKLTRERVHATIIMFCIDASAIPSDRAVDVSMCLIRNRVKQLGWPVIIETLRGDGFVWHAPEGFEIL